MVTRARLVVLLTALLVLAPAMRSTAVTNGQDDGANHPYVGLTVAYDANGVPLQACSGSLVTPTVFLTAAHCVEHPHGTRSAVWFAPGPIQTDTDYLIRLLLDPSFSGSCAESPLFDGYPCAGGVTGTPHPHPDFCFGCETGLPNQLNRDVAVIKLDQPVPTSMVSRLARLPGPGLVGTLDNGTAVDLLGYGQAFQYHLPGKYFSPPPPGARWAGSGTRQYASTELVATPLAHSTEFIRLSQNGSDGDGGGGVCFGDSGGPDLLSGTDTVLAVNSFVTNYNCKGVAYSQRVDDPELLAWLHEFVE